MRKMSTKFLSVALSAVLAISAISFTGVKETKAADEIINYAPQAVVTTSSRESAELTGSNVNDEDLTTRWSSYFINNQWVKLDFGRTVKIGSIQLFWEAAYAAEYTIEWSNDDVEWFNAVTWHCNQYSQETSHMFYNRPVRYIRITCTKRGTGYGVSLYEVKAFGYAEQETATTTTEEPTTTTQEPQTFIIPRREFTELQKNATVTASSVESPEYAPENVIDKNNSTRWSSAFRDGEYLMFDFGEVCELNSVVIYWEAAYAAEYTIEGSVNGTDWFSIPINDGGIINMVSYNKYTAGYDVRYVKLTCVRRATPYGVSIYDVTMMGIRTYDEVYEIPVTTTAEPTTTTTTTTEEPTTTTTTPEPTTETTTASTVNPLEVIGAVAGTPRDNTVSVVWGQDAERMSSGCLYNVYVNNNKVLSNVICNYYELTDLGVGKATVVIKSVLNGIESEGVKFTVDVTGEIAGTNVAPYGTATASNEFNDNVAGYAIDGLGNTVWMAQQAFPYINIDLGEEKDLSTVQIIWSSQSYAPGGYSIFLKDENENTVAMGNFDLATNELTSNFSANVKARYIYVGLGRYNNLAHFYAITDIKAYEK